MKTPLTTALRTEVMHHLTLFSQEMPLLKVQNLNVQSNSHSLVQRSRVLDSVLTEGLVYSSDWGELSSITWQHPDQLGWHRGVYKIAIPQCVSSFHGLHRPGSASWF